MILKIKGWKESDWFLIDKIKRIHYDYVTRGYLEKPQESGIINNWINSNDKSAKPEEDRFIRCILQIEGKEFEKEYIVVFETIGYLCNDTGQTIEKLVP